MELLILWGLCGILAAFVASSRGGSGCAGLILGCVLGPFGVLFAFFLGGPKAREEQEISTGQKKKCPMCAELVQAEAVICKHCRHRFAP